jgi:hypothetical protein
VGRIILIGTVHKELGACNENELIRILETIGPDVIFEELRPSDLEARYRDKSKHTLEMRAITKYLEVRPARQVPVDDYKVPESFGRNMRSLEHFVESRSRDYCAVMDDIHQMESEFGFRCLNSPNHIAQIKKSDQLFKETVYKYGSEDLKKLLSMWDEQVRSRENSMLDNVYGFCRTSTFTDGVFLVGAAHMPSIIEGIESRMKQESSLVDWKIWSRL